VDRLAEVVEVARPVGLVAVVETLLAEHQRARPVVQWLFEVRQAEVLKVALGVALGATGHQMIQLPVVVLSRTVLLQAALPRTVLP